jgi:hypothetical protein
MIRNKKFILTLKSFEGIFKKRGNIDHELFLLYISIHIIFPANYCKLSFNEKKYLFLIKRIWLNSKNTTDKVLKKFNEVENSEGRKIIQPDQRHANYSFRYETTTRD